MERYPQNNIPPRGEGYPGGAADPWGQAYPGGPGLPPPPGPMGYGMPPFAIGRGRRPEVRMAGRTFNRMCMLALCQTAATVVLEVLFTAAAMVLGWNFSGGATWLTSG